MGYGCTAKANWAMKFPTFLEAVTRLWQGIQLTLLIAGFILAVGVAKGSVYFFLM
jgi:hypothetical protein